MKILLTGATGMVGRNLLDYPPFSNFQVSAPPRQEMDLMNYEEVRRHIQATRPEIIVHAAGRVGGIEANRRNNFGFLVENMQMGMNLIKAADEAGVERVINLASSCMYPKDVPTLLSEDLLLTGPLEPTNEGYAIAKIGVTRMCEFLSREKSDRAYKTIIPCNLYGPWDKFDTVTAHLVPSAIRKVSDAKSEGKRTVEIWGDGTARREFMFVTDLCEFIVAAITHFDSLPGVLNVGVGRDHSVLEYYEAAARSVGYEGEFSFDLSKPVGMKRKLLDSRRVNEWGWFAKYELLEGIRITYDFYMRRSR